MGEVLMCPPTLNINDRRLRQWFKIYSLISQQAIVYLLPPNIDWWALKYSNIVSILPHIKDDKIILIMAYRKDEYFVNNLLKELGFTIHNIYCNSKMPLEIKYLRDNIYFGGYAVDSDIQYLEEIEDNFGCKIIKIPNKTNGLDSLSNRLFILDKQTVICSSDVFDSKTIKEIEKFVNIIDIPTDYLQLGLTSLIRLGYVVYSGSILTELSKKDLNYKLWKNRDDKLIEICEEYGIELVFVNISEFYKNNIFLSDFIIPLFHEDIKFKL